MSDTIAAILADKGSTVLAVRPTTTVFQAVEEMNRSKVGSVLVQDQHGELVGIFTERDVLTRVVCESVDPRKTKVSEVMSRRPLTISPNDSIEATMDLIREKRCRHLPVVRHGRLLGLISIGDILRRVSRMHEYEAENLRAYISGSYF